MLKAEKTSQQQGTKRKAEPELGQKQHAMSSTKGAAAAQGVGQDRLGNKANPVSAVYIADAAEWSD